MFKFPGIWIPSIQSIGNERYNQPRALVYTAGYTALCLTNICDTPAMRYYLWCWTCGTYIAVTNDLVALIFIIRESFISLMYETTHIGCFLNYFASYNKSREESAKPAKPTALLILVILPVLMNFKFSRPFCHYVLPTLYYKYTLFMVHTNDSPADSKHKIPNYQTVENICFTLNST